MTEQQKLDAMWRDEVDEYGHPIEMAVPLPVLENQIPLFEKEEK